MKISEIYSAPEVKSPPTSNSVSHILVEVETLVKQTEAISSQTHPPPPTLSSSLRHHLSLLSSFLPFPNSIKLLIWKLAYRLWNTCVDLSNSIPSSSPLPEIIKLRHVSSDLIYLVRDLDSVPSPFLKISSFYFKTGLLWHEIAQFQLASSCFDRSTDLLSKSGVSNSRVSDPGERKLLLELNLARSRTAWKISDRNLAVNLLTRSKTLLFGSAENYHMLALQYLNLGKEFLTENEVSSSMKLMNECIILCDKGIEVARNRSEAVDLKNTRSKCLRFTAAAHLQGKEYESVLKCVRVLKEEGEKEHPSLFVLAMKAWLGMGRVEEAEKELTCVVVSKGIPEKVWVSAVEEFFQAVGVEVGDRGKRVFMRVLDKFDVSASAAVRMVRKMVVVGVEGSNTRVKVVGELAGDSKVLAIFGGHEVAKERTEMHAILWNCGADQFRCKDYGTSAIIFEKSLLYVPYNVENRVVRAKGFRVLCLCYLALSQLDRAQEYINEAEKLEPNIASAFLKYKIYLQKKDHKAATDQLQSMTTCLDFTPDFLLLSAHEAVACSDIPVACAALSQALNFTKSKENTQASQVVLLRTIITLLMCESGKEEEVMEYTKRAHTKTVLEEGRLPFGVGEKARRERNWFGINSWNMGVKAGKCGDHVMCAEFMRMSSDFYGVSVEDGVEDRENDSIVCRALVLSVSALISAERVRGMQMPDSEVREAIHVLARAGKLLHSMDQLQGEDDTHLIHTVATFDLYGRIPTMVSDQLNLLKAFASTRHCDPRRHLLRLGLAAADGPRANPRAAHFALDASLSAFLSSPSPHYPTIALLFRKLLTLTGEGDADVDENVYNLYRRAHRVMVGLKEGEYPRDEGVWLATTAWNRAALPLRLGQLDSCTKWMSLGLDIARIVPEMDTYVTAMDQFFAALPTSG